jgi:hypothetical protein
MLKPITSATLIDSSPVTLQGTNTPHFRLRPGAGNCGGFPVTVFLNGATEGRTVEHDGVHSHDAAITSLKMNPAPGGGAPGDVWFLEAATSLDDAPRQLFPVDAQGAQLVRQAGHRRLVVLESNKNASAWLELGYYDGTASDYVVSASAPTTLVKAFRPSALFDVSELHTLALVVEHYTPGAQNHACAMGFFLDFYASPDGGHVLSVPMGSVNNVGGGGPWSGEPGYIFAGTGQPEAQTSYTTRTSLRFPYVAVRVHLSGGVSGGFEHARYGDQLIITQIRLFGW